MFKFIVLSALVTLCAADHIDRDATVRSFSDVRNENNYKYAYETSNGIAAQEEGQGGYYAQGSYQYYSPEGNLIQLAYSADEAGFHPSGDHLPTPPPIPAAILRAIEWIKAHPEKQDPRGQYNEKLYS